MRGTLADFSLRFEEQKALTQTWSRIDVSRFYAYHVSTCVLRTVSSSWLLLLFLLGLRHQLPLTCVFPPSATSNHVSLRNAVWGRIAARISVIACLCTLDDEAVRLLLFSYILSLWCYVLPSTELRRTTV